MTPQVITNFVGEYWFLSNFYLCRPGLIWLHYGYSGRYDHWFPSVEHAYQASKFLDPAKWDIMRACPDGKDAKRVGTRLSLSEDAVRSDWKLVNVSIMTHLLRSKFRDEHLRRLLLRTGDARLVEGNYWHDNFWGDCWCGRPRCSGIGDNQLGHLLELVRWELRNVDHRGIIQTKQL